MQETLRDTSDVQPNSKPIPRVCGAAGSIGLDLLCCVPALIVLGRRLGKGATPSTPRSFIPLALLSVWMLASTIWASDKFAALIYGCNWAAAVVLTWAASQLVRDWVSFRFVVVIILSLLPVYVITALQGKAQVKDDWDYYVAHRDEVLKSNGLEAGSFGAEQFERKLKLGESFGFFTSPNTFGGASSLLLVVAMGLFIQTSTDFRQRPWTAVTLVVLVLGGCLLLVLTRSRGAAATFGFSVLVFAVLARYRASLARHAKHALVVGIAIVVVAIAAVVGHGLYHGKLPTSTLTFRWKYWVGSAPIVKEHPILGVGWGNFGLYYLAHRLPSAPEEIKDPHDVLVRFTTELGIVGVILLVVWLIWLWRDLTLQRQIEEKPKTAPRCINFIAAVTCGAFVIYLLFGADWLYDVFESFLLNRLLFLGVMLLCASLIALRSLQSQAADDRPAPWALYGVLLAVGGMLIHNLIDFSLFETGPMFLFFLLTGSAMGLRAGSDSPVSRYPGMKFSLALMVWIGVAGALWIPLGLAAGSANAADDAARNGRFEQASKLYLDANRQAWRLNPQYALRAARTTPLPMSLDDVRLAIDENPHDSQNYALLAGGAMAMKPPEAATAKMAFEKTLQLDPNNVEVRLNYADALALFGERAEAKRQYELALRYNDLLDLAEKKRLSSDRLKEVHGKIDALR